MNLEVIGVDQYLLFSDQTGHSDTQTGERSAWEQRYVSGGELSVWVAPSESRQSFSDVCLCDSSAAAVGTTRPRPSQHSQHLDPPAPSIPAPTAFNQTLIQQQNGDASAHLMMHLMRLVVFWWCHVTPHAAASLSKALSLVLPEASPVSPVRDDEHR